MHTCITLGLNTIIDSNSNDSSELHETRKMLGVDRPIGSIHTKREVICDYLAPMVGIGVNDIIQTKREVRSDLSSRKWVWDPFLWQAKCNLQMKITCSKCEPESDITNK